MALSVEVPRDRYGRPLIIPPDGGKPVAYTRCTTFVDVLEDKHNLTMWEKRMVALGLASRKDLLLAVAATRPDEKKKLNALVDQAKEAAKGSAGATIGTALHALTERIDRGEEIGPLPDEYAKDMEAYRRATADLEPVEIEQFSVLDELKIGGTPDRVVKYRDRYFIADVKTGDIDFGALKIAMQLSVYSRSVPYDFETGQRIARAYDVDTHQGIVIHLPEGKGKCELRWVDIGRGWDAVQTATEVRSFRALKDWYSPWSKPLAVVEEF